MLDDLPLSKTKLATAGFFDGAIVTQIVPRHAFYRAEDKHQNFFNEHESAGYCRVIIAPKLDKLRHVFADRYQRLPEGEVADAIGRSEPLFVDLSLDRQEAALKGRARPCRSQAPIRVTRSRGQADGLIPITRRNTLLKCAWSHIPHAIAIWESGSRVVLIIVHASSTRRRAM